MERITNQHIFDLLETVAIQVNANTTDIAEMKEDINKIKLDLSSKADKSDIDDLRRELALKADKTDFDELRRDLGLKADKADIDDLRLDLQTFRISVTEDIGALTSVIMDDHQAIKHLKRRYPAI